jgi:hypothetical protein
MLAVGFGLDLQGELFGTVHVGSTRLNDSPGAGSGLAPGSATGMERGSASGKGFGSGPGTGLARAKAARASVKKI